jgi:hypothetical protein
LVIKFAESSIFLVSLCKHEAQLQTGGRTAESVPQRWE